ERDIYNVVAETPAIGPATELASRGVAAQTAEAIAAESDERHGSGSGIDAKDVRDEDGDEVGTACGDEACAEDGVNEDREFGRPSIINVAGSIVDRNVAVVVVLILEGN